MNNILRIRKHLGLSQAEFGSAIGVSQGNVSHYEARGQEVPPDVARKIIVVSAERGVIITFDDIYWEDSASPKRSPRAALGSGAKTEGQENNDAKQIGASGLAAESPTDLHNCGTSPSWGA